MVRKNVSNEISDAIIELENLLVSPDVKTELVRKTLETRYIDLLKDFHRASKKRTSKRAKPNTSNSNNLNNNLKKGGRHEKD